MSILKPIDISKIVQVKFPDNQYYMEETPKTQIVIHHTVSGPKIDGDLATWLGDSSRIATHFIVDRNGIANQCFSSKYWGHHLGVKSDFLQQQGFKDYQIRNTILNKNSISIEIDSWGQLTKNSDGTYNNYYGKPITNDILIQDFPNKFRGNRYYEKYTNAEINTVGELILYLANKYKIPLDYNEDMWDVSKNALSGKPGIYTHVSYRSDKSDCIPQLELINMLKSLK